VTTAAGGYQFLGRSWDEAADALGLPDFSPENQDRAAIWHAENAYRRATGGRELLADIDAAKGDETKLDQIGRKLSGWWTSLPGGIEPNPATRSFGRRFVKQLAYTDEEGDTDQPALYSTMAYMPEDRRRRPASSAADDLIREIFSAPPEERQNVIDKHVHDLLGIPVDDRGAPGTIGLAKPLAEYPEAPPVPRARPPEAPAAEKKPWELYVAPAPTEQVRKPWEIYQERQARDVISAQATEAQDELGLPFLNKPQPTTIAAASPTPSGLLGYKVRDKLSKSERAYFKANPAVSGMAAETGDIILNPYAPHEVNKDAVARNEAFRLYLRDSNLDPQFAITDEQRRAFAGTPYEGDDKALRATIAARIYSGDPSAKATPEQTEWVRKAPVPAQTAAAPQAIPPTQPRESVEPTQAATPSAAGDLVPPAASAAPQMIQPQSEAGLRDARAVAPDMFDPRRTPTSLSDAWDKLPTTTQAAEQFKSGLETLKQGWHGTNAALLARQLDLFDRIDRGEQVPSDPTIPRWYFNPQTRAEKRKEYERLFGESLTDMIKSRQRVTGMPPGEGKFAEAPLGTSNPRAREVVEAANKGEWGDIWRVFKSDPAGIIQQFSVESAAVSAPMMAAGVVGGIAGGPTGAALAGLFGLYGSEFGPRVVENMFDELQKRKVDVNDPAAITKAFIEPG
jgi:hypothetical protein